MGEVRVQANPIRDRSAAAAVIEVSFSTFADFEAQRLELRALGSNAQDNSTRSFSASARSASQDVRYR